MIKDLHLVTLRHDLSRVQMPGNVSWGSDPAGPKSLLPQLLRLVVRALPACAFVARYILCSILIACTNRGAISRRLGLILSLCLSVVQGTLAPLLGIHPMIATDLSIDALVNGCHAINLLTLVEVDATDLEREVLRRPHSTSLERIRSGLSMLCNYRGVRTKWQVKNTPPFPPSFDGAKGLSYGYFCARQITIGLWEISTVWLAVLSFQRTMQPDTPCGRIVPGFRDWGLWRTAWPLVWIFPFRPGIDSLYRLASAASVAVGLTEPHVWPPAFSSAREAWTLRRFWGVYWHQWLRWPFGAISTAIVEKGFGMTKAHLVGRYMHVLFVFTLSGVLHLISDVRSGVPWRKSGSLLFFCSFTLAFMIEDGVQELWLRITETRGKEKAVQSNEKCERLGAVEVVTATPVWKKVVGFAWVGAWLSVSSPVYLQPYFEGLCRQGSTPDYLHMAQRLDPMVLCGGMAAMTLLVWRLFGLDL